MIDAKRITSKILVAIQAQKDVSFIKMTELKLNFKPDSIINLQKNKSLPRLKKFLSSIANEKQVILVLRFASQVTNALTKLINHNDLHNVDNNDAILDSKHFKQMKQKPLSSIYNNFSEIFGLVIWVINYWSKNFVWYDIIIGIKQTINYYHKVPPE